MGRLDGRVALITGAGRGIGKAIALLFAKEGAKVVVTSFTRANVDKVVDQIEAAGGEAIGLTCDVGDPGQIKAAIEGGVKAFGGLDILVNNAFDMTSARSSVIDLSTDQLQRQFDTGPVAYLRAMQAAYPYLKRSGSGRVINLASAIGVQGTAGYTPYAMAKEAIRALTRVSAREWGADKITINNILPIADTDATDAATKDQGGEPTWVPDTPLARVGSCDEDIAPIALFLASADGQFLTGYSMAADGGFLIDTGR